MAIICPHCRHELKLKSARAGRYSPKCTKCGKPFALTVSGEGESLSFAVAPIDAHPDATAPSLTPIPKAAQSSEATQASATAPKKTPAREIDSLNLDATAAPGQLGLDNADFSVAASAVRVSSPDETAALLAMTAPPAMPGNKGINLDATEAGDEDSVAEPESGADGEMPSVLGNYQIVKELGRGGMGAVYLARQVTLDRAVALKVMNRKWASNPAFLVRFTREAYAAAQLVHHNVVQVYDIGEDRGINYFSMEFVQGQSLGDLLKKEKKLDPATAAGYILQAARGLKFAHDRGMIHRDIKPDNLMLNDQGVVKVADLGLVRTPGMADEKPIGEEIGAQPASKSGKPAGRTLSSLSNVTMAGQAMGTPSYMAPEQARDATKVDHRADIYSLGCTLYVMVTGRPVFQGKTALEVMTKHARDEVIRPDLVAKEVPRGLGDIVLKMLAKDPDDRYASMDEVIKALEDFLGLEGAKASQEEKHLRTLEEGVKAYRTASGAALRSTILLGFFGGCTFFFLVLALFGAWRTAGCILSLGVLTALAYFVVSGLTKKGPLFLEVRDFALSLSWLDWVKTGVGFVLFLGVLWLIGLFGSFLAAAILATCLAVGMYFALDRQVATKQAEATEKVESMLKTLRLRGISEEAVQEFVAKYAGDHWEEFFEAMFGYESKLAARALYGKGAKGNRPKFAGWRDPIIHWIDNFQRARKEARERRHLQKIEQANLVAQGIDAGRARQQAEAVAEAMVQVAADIRQASPAPAAVPIPAEVTVAPELGATMASPRPAPRIAPPKRVNVQEMFQFAEAPVKSTSSGSGRRLPNPFALVFGGGVRFLLGAGLLLIALFWLNTHGLIPSLGDLDDRSLWQKLWNQGNKTEPLALPVVPSIVLQALCSLNTAIAGAVLIASAIWRSWKIGFLVMLAAAVTVIGPVTGYVPEVGPLNAQVLCLAIGGVLAALGFLFGRDT